MPSLLQKRFDDTTDNGDGIWYYSSEASAIKYGILFSILLLGFLIIFGSWFHAKRRLEKGLPVLAYHRWLVRPSARNPNAPENNFSFYGQQSYDMQHIPPPVYNPNSPQPPAYYGPPAGYVPPAGYPVPPPGAYIPAGQTPMQQHSKGHFVDIPINGNDGPSSGSVGGNPNAPYNGAPPNYR
ncbi:hypothetical protein BZA77DRAFT_76878 [Pyronema omphalodes]|nr:hypothetical protein BZA77DRAFT_76878 [Pyronema omphalodes]